jgi:integrase
VFIGDGTMLRGILDGEVSPLDLEHWFTELGKRIAMQPRRKPRLHYNIATPLGWSFSPPQRQLLAYLFWESFHLNWQFNRRKRAQSAKRQRSPLVLSPEQVKFGLAELEFRDQLLVFLEGALGIRQGELGALRWLSCDFDNMSISVQHSYYWRRGGNLKGTKTEASAKLLPMHPSLKHSLQEWRSQSLYNKPEDFVFPSERLQQAVRSSFSVKEEDSACIQTNRNHGCRLAHVSALGWNHAGRDGRASTDNPRLLAAQQPSCHEQIPAGDIEDQTLGTRTNWSTRFCRRVFCRRQT